MYHYHGGICFSGKVLAGVWPLRRYGEAERLDLYSHQFRLSMEHHKRVSVNAPTHSAAGFWFELGLM